jgi:hypothetical protein
VCRCGIMRSAGTTNILVVMPTEYFRLGVRRQNYARDKKLKFANSTRIAGANLF